VEESYYTCLSPQRGIIEVEDESLLSELERNDAELKVGNTYESYPMRAITK